MAVPYSSGPYKSTESSCFCCLFWNLPFPTILFSSKVKFTILPYGERKIFNYIYKENDLSYSETDKILSKHTTRCAVMFPAI